MLIPMPFCLCHLPDPPENQKNKELIENSLEIIEFNMNFIQSTRMSPGSNNYNRNASSSYGVDMGPGAFDAKQ